MVEIKNIANEWLNLEREVSGEIYQRFPVKTHIIHIKEDLTPIFDEIEKVAKPWDFIWISEKFLTISEWRLIHKSFLKPSRLAKVIVFFMKKNMSEKAIKNNDSHAIPEKMQACILIAGWWRIFFAFVLWVPLTIIYKLFWKKKWWFYILAWNKISDIDWTFSVETPPFNEFAKIYPEHPEKTCEEIAKKYTFWCVVTDSNNINTKILWFSKKIWLSEEELREVFLDNPMGQWDYRTPIILVRKK